MTNKLHENRSKENPVVLVTGSAQRIGASIVQTLHAAGYNTIIHYRNSKDPAEALAKELNSLRENSATCIAAELDKIEAINLLAETALSVWGRMDALVNNASSFYATPIGTATEIEWTDLVNSNMKAPFFLAQALSNALTATRGAIVNITDVYADKPLAHHPIYCMAKSGNTMLTKSLALELSPHVRVNGIAPGAILWPDQGGATDPADQQQLLEKIPLARTGLPEDVANTVLFLLRDAPYITGQIIALDGGRSINF